MYLFGGDDLFRGGYLFSGKDLFDSLDGNNEIFGIGDLWLSGYSDSL